jgi:hypothetical protein
VHGHGVLVCIAVSPGAAAFAKCCSAAPDEIYHTNVLCDVCVVPETDVMPTHRRIACSEHMSARSTARIKVIRTDFAYMCLASTRIARHTPPT